MPKIVDHEQRRKDIAKIAAKLISESGIEKLTARKIAELSGFSRSVVENYFENKQELVQISLDWANEKFGRRVMWIQSVSATRYLYSKR